MRPFHKSEDLQFLRIFMHQTRVNVGNIYSVLQQKCQNAETLDTAGHSDFSLLNLRAVKTK